MSETKQGNKSGKLLQILAGIEDGTVGTALAAAMRTDQAQGEFLTELYEVSDTEDPALLEEMVKKAIS